MIDPLTYLMTYTGWKAWETAAAACFFPMLMSIVAPSIMILFDIRHGQAVNKHGHAAVALADPGYDARQAHLHIIIGAVIFLMSIYIAAWYCNQVPDNAFKEWFGWFGATWKTVY